MNIHVNKDCVIFGKPFTRGRRIRLAVDSWPKFKAKHGDAVSHWENWPQKFEGVSVSNVEDNTGEEE